nr:MAG TPA: hypothetical protein [Crassvirales sp.]
MKTSINILNYLKKNKKQILQNYYHINLKIIWVRI